MSKNDQDIETLLELHRRVARVTFRQIQGALSGANTYTMASMAILKVLDEHGALSQHQIAQELCHSDAAVSRQVSLLHEKGEIIVRPSDKNRKRLIVELSDKGRTTINDIRQLVEGHFKEALSALSDAEIAMMIKSNQRLLEVLTARQTKES